MTLNALTLSMTSPRIFPVAVSTTGPVFACAPQARLVPMIRRPAPVPRNFRRLIFSPFILQLLIVGAVYDRAVPLNPVQKTRGHRPRLQSYSTLNANNTLPERPTR